MKILITESRACLSVEYLICGICVWSSFTCGIPGYFMSHRSVCVCVYAMGDG